MTVENITIVQPVTKMLNKILIVGTLYLVLVNEQNRYEIVSNVRYDYREITECLKVSSSPDPQ